MKDITIPMKILSECSYSCRLCGRKYHFKETAIKCFDRGIEDAILNVGDTVIFNDCEETPLLYGLHFMDSDDILLHGFENPSIRYTESFAMDTIRRIQAGNYINNPVEYKVVKVENDGHKCLYHLGRGETVEFYAKDGEKEFRYPVIYGNILMQKILDKTIGGTTGGSKRI